ncbi:hypothetical protein [Kitasatospora cineracea]|uniref:hypothetical protein n=1 Tax=Kitasatospora cineracea TaxID=88074 RepID=UPI0036CCD074
MAFMVLTAQFVSVNGTDLSDFCTKAELGMEVEEKDVTTFGAGGWKVVLGGIKSAGLDVEFIQDFDVAALDAIMWPLFGTVVPFQVRASQAAVGASNPQYSGNVLIKEYKPLQGSVGDEAKTGASYPSSGPVARAVA